MTAAATGPNLGEGGQRTFDAMTHLVGLHGERLDGHDGRMDGHDAALTAHAGRMDGHEAALSEHHDRISALEKANSGGPGDPDSSGAGDD